MRVRVPPPLALGFGQLIQLARGIRPIWKHSRRRAWRARRMKRAEKSSRFVMDSGAEGEIELLHAAVARRKDVPVFGDAIGMYEFAVVSDDLLGGVDHFEGEEIDAAEGGEAGRAVGMADRWR